MAAQPGPGRKPRRPVFSERCSIIIIYILFHSTGRGRVCNVMWLIFFVSVQSLFVVFFVVFFVAMCDPVQDMSDAQETAICTFHHENKSV